MTAKKGPFCKLSLTSLVFCIVLVCSVVIKGEPASPLHLGIPDDWSHHHLVFSDIGTYDQAIANGTITKWINLRYDPRYILQQIKRNPASFSRQMQDLEVEWRWRRRKPTPWMPAPSSHLKRDWSMSMGSGGSVSVGAGQSPAKYSFSDSAAFCDSATTPDYVVFNTSTAGASNQASIIAYDNLYSGCTGLHPLGYWAYNTNSGTIVTSPVLSLDGSQVAFVQSVSNAASLVLLKWSKSASSTASSPLQLSTSTSSVQVTGCSWSTSSTTINCTGGNFTTAFDVGAPMSGGGLSNGETITAVNSSTQIIISVATTNTGSNQNLNITPQYTTNISASGCSWNGAMNSTVTCTSGGFTAAADVGAALVGFNAGFPNGETITAVNSATNFTVSPALPTSGGGSSGSGATGTIYALSSTVVPTSNYRGCASPCMTTLALSGSPNDTNSSPFYDYTNDVLYVGDNSGVLHKFTNIFLSGTPAEITGGGTTSGWPQTISANILTSPVYDSSSGNVFVSSGNGGPTGVELHYIPSTGGSSNIVNSATLGKNGNGIVDGPIVDSTAAKVYVFVSQDNGAGPGFTAVYQFTTTFASGGSGTEETLGQGNGGNIAYDGTFDNTYFSSSSGSGPSGNLYVCGTNSSGGSVPMLYRVPINDNAMGTPLAGPALSTGNVNCSPISEVYNTSAAGGPFDWIFLSVAGDGEGDCAGNNGCAMGFAVTGWLATTAYTQSQGIVDSNFNVEKVTTAGTSGGSQPTWGTTVGGATTDGTVTWTNEGPLTLTGFTTNQSYALNAVIVDSNGNLERVTTAGTSGGSAPSWNTTFGNTTFGNTTTSGGVTFTNQGFGASSLIETNGTSGIIIDNIVASGTLTGASQVYFSPLGGQACAGNNGAGSTGQGMGGCAVQASQSGLQ
jgi:hypothetical protein